MRRPRGGARGPLQSRSVNPLRLLEASAALLLLAGCGSSGSGGCNTAHDCDTTQRCVSGACAARTGPGIVGESCTADGDCASGLACSAPGSGFTGGACSVACGAGCAAGAACADLRGTPVNAKLCAPTCTADKDCRAGYACCGAQGNVCLPAGLCGPPVSSVTCAAPVLASGGTISAPQPPAGTCGRPIQPSAAPAAQVQALGTHRVGDSVAFNVPAGTGSVSIFEQATPAASTGRVYFTNGGSDDNSAVPRDLSSPDGKIFDDLQSPQDPTTAQVFYAGGSPSTATLTVPNTSPSLAGDYAAGGLKPGGWKLTVGDFAYECTQVSNCADGGSTSGQYDVTVVTKPGLQAQGVLDLAFYIVGSSPFSAASAPTNAQARRIVQTISDIYAQAGVCVRNATFYDVPAWAKTAYGTTIDADHTGPCDTLDQMFLLSQPGQNTLNFFLVQSITSTSNGGGQVVGIDGTIPGPASVGGTVHSGAAVSIADLTNPRAQICGSNIDVQGCAADEVAYIAAHEGGHFFGLYHLSESSGESFDPLTDTPTCKCESCVAASSQPSCGKGANPPIVAATDCAGTQGTCSGAQYLMFWQLNAQVSQAQISPQQGQLMRLNLVVQ